MDRCFCELTPLYVLDLLTPEDREWVESQIAESPELASELAELKEVVGLLPLAAPIVPPAEDLKARLFDRLDLELPEPPLPKTFSRPSPNLPELVKSGKLDWQPYRVPGVKIAVLYRDLATRRASSLVQAAVGIVYPAHRHAGTEEIYMLEGELTFGDRVYRAGDRIVSAARSRHPVATTATGCMFFVNTSIDDEY
jgi:anti-sigma factor ChrR (cupin superfamily)